MANIHEVIAALHRHTDYGASVDDAALVEEWLEEQKPPTKTTISKKEQ